MGGCVCAAAVAVALAGCGSGASSSASSSAAGHSASAPTTSSAPASASSTTASSSSAAGSASSTSAAAPQASVASVPRGCAPAHTKVSLGAARGATGHIGLILLLRNSGTTACQLTGYPGAALVAAAGRHRELQVPRTPQGFMGGLSPTARANPVVRLAPGLSASALLEGQDVNGPGGKPCPSYSGLLVTPPNQTVTVSFRRGLTICQPQIHPVVAGTSGRQGS